MRWEEALLVAPVAGVLFGYGNFLGRWIAFRTLPGICAMMFSGRRLWRDVRRSLEK